MLRSLPTQVVIALMCWSGSLLLMVTGPEKPTTQATAPDEIMVRTVADIPPGAQADASPEALVVGDDKKCWLNRLQPLGDKTGMVVHFMKNGTYEVEVQDTKLRWIKVPINEDMQKFLVPVAKVHVAKPK
jgi:hypothetical protein